MQTKEEKMHRNSTPTKQIACINEKYKMIEKNRICDSIPKQ